MPQLPDYTALGGVPDANSGRPIASARSMFPHLVGQGVEQLGAGLQSAGNSIDQVVQTEKRQDNLVQVANNDTALLKRQQEAHQNVTSDNDYATQPKRYEAASNAIIQDLAPNIADPRMRALWIADAQKNSVARLGVVESQAATGVKQTRVVQLKDNLDSYQSIVTNPKTDDLTRQQAQENIHSTITAAQNEGVITPEGAQQWNTTYVQGSEALRRQALIHTKDGNKAVMTPAAPPAGGSQDQPPPGLSPAGLEIWKRNNAGDKGSVPAKPYAPSAAEQQAEITTGDKGTPATGGAFKLPADGNLSPLMSSLEAQHNLPTGYLATTAGIESRGKAHGPDSSAGAKGLFQFVPSTARQYGLTNPYDPVASTKAAAQLADDNAKALRSALGREPTAGELYLAHQQGSDGAAKLLANPDASAASIVGTKAVIQNGGSQGMTAGQFAGLWLKKFGEATPVSSVHGGPDADPFSTAYDNLRRDSPGLSPQQYYALANEAVAAHNSFKADDTANIKQAEQDAPAAIQTTGSYTGYDPTQQDFRNAHGVVEGDRQFETYQAKKDVAQAINGMQGQTNTAIQSMINGAAPTQTGEGAALGLAKYAALKTAGEAVIESRKTDPAAAVVRAFPKLGQQPDPTSQAQNPLFQQSQARLAAQTQFGIPPQDQHVLMTGEAQAMAAKLMSKDSDPKQALDALQQQYGAAWPQVMNDLVKLGKLPPAYQAVQALDDPHDAALLARAINETMPGSDGKARDWNDILGNAGGKPVATTIKDTVRNDPVIQSYAKSLSDSGASLGQVDGMVQSVETLAFAKRFYQGEDPATASADAVKSFVGKFDFMPNGGARVPATAFNAVTSNATAMLGTMTPQNVAVPKGFGQQGLPSQQEYLDVLRASPTWITAPKGDALWLMDNGGRLVRGTDGTPLQVPFSAPASDGPAGPGGRFRARFDQTQGFGSPPSTSDAPATSREQQIQHEDTGDITVSGGKEQQGFFSWATGQEPDQKSLQANPMTGWPTDADVSRAMKGGQFYGQDEAFLSGSKANIVGEAQASPETMPKGKATYPEVFKPEIMTGRLSDIFDKLDTGTKSRLMATDPETRNAIVKSALVANRIPLAALGFDPRKFFVEVAKGRDVPMEARTVLTVAGAYDPVADKALSNTAYNSNIVHESIHRGLDMLRREYPEQMKKLEDDLPKEESIVRYTMMRDAGNQEYARGGVATQQVDEAKYAFEQSPGRDAAARDALEKVNALAAKLYVKQHGKGPK